MKDQVLNKLLHAIKQAGYDEKEPLIACGINANFFTDWKKKVKDGKIMEPSYIKIAKLADFLGLSLDFLVKGQDISCSSESVTDPEIIEVDLKMLIKQVETLSNKNREALKSYADYLVYSENASSEKTSSLLHEENKNKNPLRIVSSQQTDNEDLEYDELPMYGSVAAGEPIILPDAYSVADLVSVPKTKETSQADFALRVKGDSMEPQIHDGDLVLIKMQSAADYAGQIVVASIDNDATLKKIFEFDDHFELRSINQKYAPIIVPKSEFTDFRIIGIKL
ncbi:MAG: S24 family peptidase [Peptostreptococcaceae bacterium]|nr:S24 family peptidase [Peptostreptococcaceae bacterium]